MSADNIAAFGVPCYCKECGTADSSRFYTGENTNYANHSRCRRCLTEKAKAYRHSHPDMVKTQNANRATYKKQWHEKNRERRLQKSRDNRDHANTLARAWREANKERWQAYMRQYRETNKERLSEYNRRNANEWRKAHPELRAASQANRRARKRGCEGAISAAQVAALYRQQKGRCASCQTPLNNLFHKDHIMPLVLGGEHRIENIQLLCPPCNLRKRDKHPDQWAAEMGRLFI